MNTRREWDRRDLGALLYGLLESVPLRDNQYSLALDVMGRLLSRASADTWNVADLRNILDALELVNPESGFTSALDALRMALGGDNND